MHIDHLLQAKKEISKQFKATKGVIGFGLGTDCIKIYIEHSFDESILPTKHRDVPIEIIKTQMPIIL